MNLKQKLIIANIVSNIEKLILKLNNRSYVFRSSIRDVVKCSFDSLKDELNESKDIEELLNSDIESVKNNEMINKINDELIFMHKYVFNAKEKGDTLKIIYLNNIYSMLINLNDNKKTINERFLIKLNDKLKNICDELKID